jgi:haloacetate dehalogenase
MLDDFTAGQIDVGDTTIFVRTAGAGPPLLLLHGFPQTHLMWRAIAPILARQSFVVCADLRGYGRSGCPPSTADHGPYAKRTMAQDMVRMMARLGCERFSVAGHDRGGRVAYRLALDHPSVISRIAVLDVVPTYTAWQHANAEFALDFWPWSLLAQPEPLPERILAAAADAIVEQALGSWGSPPHVFPPDVRTAYLRALTDPRHAHAICEEYRAAATLDREHDGADLASGRRIACPLLVLWSRRGSLERWYHAHGGPLGVWRSWADDLEGRAVDAGHFFPEETPEETADVLGRFFAGPEGAGGDERASRREPDRST